MKFKKGLLTALDYFYSSNIIGEKEVSDFVVNYEIEPSEIVEFCEETNNYDLSMLVENNKFIWEEE